ncbi:homoserine kinase [Streptococcus sp. H31]|uniref:homoserine kinase n=1 Tax=Streptococcus huangxiaojuni TaxID=3237239 RepID=UPI0034A51E29
MKITVPATSANLGPGFDSVGIALSKYLSVEILGAAASWEIIHDLGESIPTDESNLLIATALKVKGDLPPQRLKMDSEIPLARGLGSSSSVIVAGIELANQLAGLQLTDEEKLKIATEIEGHPDNVAPAIFGNLVIASCFEGTVSSVVSDFPADCSFIAFIPDYELKTSESRQVLPQEFSYKEAVAASSIANLALAGLLTGDLVKAGKAIESDLFHERFRQPLVKEFAPIKNLGRTKGAYATYLSGAGPTVMMLAPKEKEEALYAGLQALGLRGDTFILQVDQQGVSVKQD